MSQVAPTPDLINCDSICINGHAVTQVWCVDGNVKSHIPMVNVNGVSAMPIHFKACRTSRSLKNSASPKWLIDLVNEGVPKVHIDKALQPILKHIKLDLARLRGKRSTKLKIRGDNGDLLPPQVSVVWLPVCDFDVLSTLGAKGVIRFVATRTSMCPLALYM
jgi:hypothetical protein